MKIELAKNAGFCSGVKHTLAMVWDNMDKMKKPIRIYGNLVHNEEVIKELIKQGIEIIDDLKKAKDGTLIITAHGISPLVKNELLKRKDLKVFDTTCPQVLRVHNLAKSLSQKKRKVLIFGDVSHEEVKGIKGATNEQAIVFLSERELDKMNFDFNQEYGLVVQTTQDLEKFTEIEKKIKNKIKGILIFNTICGATRQRQKEARELAEINDVVIIVGSRTSANTNRLYEIAFRINPNSYLISRSDEIKIDWLKNIKKVGITAGASTPDWIIKEVIQKIKNLTM
ncbi:MAG: 4-hydroxy-3-methylbut-2-enyl diphosphate reductase [Patescibacteria group bacterium]|nr:4-hydroxy-3-methylbut-2-enyl diphosphate reductase [Patescibacteria group bacterium]